MLALLTVAICLGSVAATAATKEFAIAGNRLMWVEFQRQAGSHPYPGWPVEMKGRLSLQPATDLAKAQEAITRLSADKKSTPIHPDSVFEPSFARPDVSGSVKSLFVMQFVSAPRNLELRNKYRDQIRLFKERTGITLLSYFVMGKPGKAAGIKVNGLNEAADEDQNPVDVKMLEKLQQEALAHDDVFIGDFLDTFGTLRTKFKYAHQRFVESFPQVPFLVMSDDDVVINFEMLLTSLTAMAMREWPVHQVFAGIIIRGKVFRDPKSTYYMSYDIWPEEEYPPYASGPFRIVSRDFSDLVAHAPEAFPDYRIGTEDTILGLYAHVFGVPATNIDGAFNYEHETCEQGMPVFGCTCRLSLHVSDHDQEVFDSASKFVAKHCIAPEILKRAASYWKAGRDNLLLTTQPQ